MKTQYLRTERAHFMCPNMHFGILLEIEKQYQKELVEETLDRMATAHPFLRSLISYEDGTDRLFYRITDVSQVEIRVMKDKSILWDDYKAIGRNDWNVFENGLLKVYIYPEEQGMKVLFITHHLLVDGRGALALAEEFANDYVGHVKPVYVEEQLMDSITNLPPKSKLSGISSLMIKQANKRWKKENNTVDYDTYREFVESFSKTHHVDYETYILDNNEVTQMLQLCHDNGFTMNDLLMAYMYQKAKTKKIIIAIDIRKTLSNYNHGALGNYATASGIICKNSTEDIVELAKYVHKIVHKHISNNRKLMTVLACYFELTPTLLDAAAISALGGFESKAGKFIGSTIFGLSSPESYSITNLGNVVNKNIKSMIFIPPASPAARLTLGVVTLNGTMRACSSKN